MTTQIINLQDSRANGACYMVVTGSNVLNITDIAFLDRVNGSGPNSGDARPGTVNAGYDQAGKVLIKRYYQNGGGIDFFGGDDTDADTE